MADDGSREAKAGEPVETAPAEDRFRDQLTRVSAPPQLTRRRTDAPAGGVLAQRSRREVPRSQ
jgi:hypothetical protein